MKKLIQMSSAIGLSVFFAALAMVLLFPAAVLTAPTDVSNVVFTLGRTESELNFAWQTRKGAVAEASVQVALKSEMTGADFPEDNAQTFTGKSDGFGDGLTSYKATVSGLAASTEYVYRLGTGQAGEWSDVYEFSTRDGETYSAILIGDAQIGAGNIYNDVAGWRDTLEKALQKAPDAAFILSVGDQVNNSSAQNEYDGLLSLPQFKNLPFVPTIGNHDDHKLYSYHFNVPNESLVAGKTDAGGNYSFTYGGSLFMVVNSNSLNYGRHEAFIRDVVKKHRGARWKIVMMHHSIYGADTPRPATLDLRKSFSSIFDKYGIDVVLSGHDHIYIRSRFMLKNQVVQPLEKFPARSTPPDEIPAGAVIKPKGTLYIAAATSSGSKYYDPASQLFDYLAERASPYVPMFSLINITNTYFEIISYRTDNMAVIDRFVMVKATDDGGLRSVAVISLAAVAVLGVSSALILKRKRYRNL
jgi:3',5'-cyclic AMP phosphodiesterase CpdA